MNDIEFTVNGQWVTAPANLSSLPLVDFLQEELGLTGTKFGCGIGVCRACTVAVRRRAEAPLEVLLACSTPLAEVAGLKVFTIEGRPYRRRSSFVDRITLLNPTTAGPLTEQIDRHLKPLRQIRRVVSSFARRQW